MNNIFKLKREKSVDKDEISVTGTVSIGNLSNKLSEYSEGRLIKQIVDELAKVYVKEHGAEIMDKISPEEVEKAIKQTIAEKIML